MGLSSSLFGNKGPADTWLKACNYIRICSSGKGAIMFLAGAAFLLLQCIQSLSYSLIASLAEIIQ